jgi:hypothetical protein
VPFFLAKDITIVLFFLSLPFVFAGSLFHVAVISWGEEQAKAFG